jgi:hypothetical protein
MAYNKGSVLATTKGMHGLSLITDLKLLTQVISGELNFCNISSKALVSFIKMYVQELAIFLLLLLTGIWDIDHFKPDMALTLMHILIFQE